MSAFLTKLGNKRTVSALLMAGLLGCGGLTPALAVRYTQIFQNGQMPGYPTGYSPGYTNVSSQSVPVAPPVVDYPYRGPYSTPPNGITHGTPMITFPGTQPYQSRPVQPALPPTYQLSLEPLRAVHTETQRLQTPQEVLSNLKAKNNVPAEMAASIEVQNSKTLNAATDGQKIMITSGLLNKLTTNDQRAFVISHELSHILLSHVAKTQMRRVGLSLFNAFVIRRYVGEGSLGDLASRLGIGLVDTRSSRGFEYQADDLGVRLMSQASYNPEAAIQVFNILKANTPANQTPKFLLDHPITDDRIKVLAQKYKLQLQ